MSISLLGYAILSLLARAPLSGYDIAREIKRPHSFFFGQAQLSQIYPELARLEAARLVDSLVIAQQGKPDRKVYSLLPLGRRRLEEWVTSPTPILEVRTEFLIKAHSLWLAEAAAALPQFQAQERSHETILAAYQAELARLEEKWGNQIAFVTSADFGDYLTVKRGVGYEQEYIRWLHWAMAVLQERVRLQDQTRDPE